MQISAAPPSEAVARPASPTPSRPSRLRGLSYLRSYTREHLSSSQARSELPPPPLARSTSSLSATSPATSPPPQHTSTFERGTESGSNSSNSNSNSISNSNANSASGIIQSGENWLPAIQGRREAAPTTSTSTSTASANNTVSMMTRNRPAGPLSLAPTPTPNHPAHRRPSTVDIAASGDPLAAAGGSSAQTGNSSKEQLPVIRFSPHIETRSSRPSLRFDSLSRTLKTPGSVVRVGRYSERDNNPAHADNGLPVGFKSKVVSRRHCEFWCNDGQWYIKDVKSSSGTFLNHVRLSSPGQESRPYPVNDGDIVQLGIDFKGGEEVIFRCVKIRVECNRGWQKTLNTFNTTAHKRLLKGALKPKNRDSDAASVNSSECSICLNPVAPCQALFVAPCSHVWHFKCVRGLINSVHYPNFSCPNCRYVADLEADVEQPEEDYETDEMEEHPVVLRSADDAKAGGSDGDSGQGQSDDSYEHVQRTSSAPRLGSISRHNEGDDDLAQLVKQTSIRTPSPHAESLDSAEPGSSTVSQPIIIGQAITSSSPTSSEPLGALSTTPTSHAQFALSAGLMTPRNDAGPFVFDESTAAHNLMRQLPEERERS